ncbi:hypothetical protein JXI42_08985 [bacterium]|nr:hypothetical protein [bacterium]
MAQKFNISMILIVLMLLPVLVNAQYSMQKSVIASGGPGNMTGGTYTMEANVLSQTAATEIEESPWTDYQGFLHPGDQYITITFKAVSMNDTIGYHDPGIYDCWKAEEYDTNCVVVRYLKSGIWNQDTIFNETGISVKIDPVDPGDTNYSFISTSYQNFDSPSAHRWISIDDTLRGNAQLNGATIEPEYYEQYYTNMSVVYKKTNSGTTPGWAVLHIMEYANEDTVHMWDTTVDDETSDGPRSTWATWSDVGAEYWITDYTTHFTWYTVDLHDWTPLIKAVTAKVVYKEPETYAFRAAIVIWRTYRLIGVPVYSRDDTLEYKNNCMGGTGDAPSFGDQDLVLYDDIDPDCDFPSDDFTCGMYENWWRVMRYYPRLGAYKRYVGDTTYYELSCEPFEPGKGYWLAQWHCDSMGIDINGLIADTTQAFAIPLARYNGDDASKSHMCANPYYNPEEGNVKVMWCDAQIVHREWTGTEWTAPAVYEIEEAILGTGGAERWVYGYISLYTTSGSYIYHGYTDEDSIIQEWSGFWFQMGDDIATTDSLVLMLRPHALAVGRRMVAKTTDEPEGSDEWALKFSVASEDGRYLDISNVAGWKRDATNEVDPFDFRELPEYYYPEKDHVQMSFIRDKEALNIDYIGGEGPDFSWRIMVEPKNVADNTKYTLSWNTNDFPSNATGYLIDLENGTQVDLRQTTEYEFTVSHSFKEFDLKVEWTPSMVRTLTSSNELPREFFMSSPIPNPFNMNTTIKFGIPALVEEKMVNLEIYDLLGNKVRTLVSSVMAPGWYQAVWNGKDESGNNLPSGVYLYSFKHPEYSASRKVVLIK